MKEDKKDPYDNYIGKLLSQEEAFMNYKRRIFQKLINKYGTVDDALIIMDVRLKEMTEEIIVLRRLLGKKEEHEVIYLKEKYEEK